MTAPAAFEGLNPERALEMARELGVAVRIAARVPVEALVAELGEGAVVALQRARRGAVATTLSLESLLAEVARAARTLAAPVVVLKGMALHMDGVLAAGSRPLADLDVLVPPERAGSLHTSLVADGFTLTPGLRTGEQHLAPLRSPASGGVVEIHHAVRGVRLHGRRSATAGDVLARGGSRELAGLPGCFLPSPEVALAHLLVHGLAQHGMTREYPLTRLAADLSDLGVDEAGLAVFLAGPFAWIATDVSPEEVAAAVRLAARLRAGEDPALLATGESGESVLLGHILALALDDEYLTSLKLERRLLVPGVGARGWSVLRTLAGSVVLSRRQVDMLYGGPHSRLGYLGLRLWRPLDVLRRLAVYGWSRLRRHRRSSARRLGGTRR